MKLKSGIKAREITNLLLSEELPLMNLKDNDNAITLYSSCYKCKRRVKVEYYDEDFESEEAIFLGRKGISSIHYCPYCGEGNHSFMPYDINEPMKFDDDSDSDIESDEDKDKDFCLLDSEGADLISDDDPDEDEDPFEMDKEADTAIFTCGKCGKSFRLNPKGRKRFYCLYCGKNETT